MCDILVATPEATSGHVMLFGKNSDRQRNEAQTVEYFPAAQYSEGSGVQCQYITLPQARHTHGVLLCRPFWMWGAEMGANERGVLLGNEAVHARSAAPEIPALTGNDLVRIGLERSETAAQAVSVIIALLEQYGQGGNCGHVTPNYYHNSFMIADRTEAFVLETLDRDWLLERVSGVRTISNRYSIGEDALRVSAGLTTRITDAGWTAGSSRNYSELIANQHREHIGFAGARRERTASHLRARQGALAASDFRAVLRDHGPVEVPGSPWHPENAITCTVCMHAGTQDRAGQTTGSMVSEIGSMGAVHWVTGTAAPCLSIFKPVLLDVPLPAHGPPVTDRFNSKALWWRHEQLHRKALETDFAAFLCDIGPERDALELDFQNRVRSVLATGSAQDRAQVIAACWAEAMEKERQWSDCLKTSTSVRTGAYATTWQQMNRAAGLTCGTGE